MAGGTGLVDLKEKSITIAINVDFANFLNVAGCFSLKPAFLAGAAEINHHTFLSVSASVSGSCKQASELRKYYNPER